MPALHTYLSKKPMTPPLINSNLRTISSVALLLIAFTVGRTGYLEFIIREAVYLL